MEQKYPGEAQMDYGQRSQPAGNADRRYETKQQNPENGQPSAMNFADQQMQAPGMNAQGNQADYYAQGQQTAPDHPAGQQQYSQQPVQGQQFSAQQPTQGQYQTSAPQQGQFIDHPMQGQYAQQPGQGQYYASPQQDQYYAQQPQMQPQFGYQNQPMQGQFATQQYAQQPMQGQFYTQQYVQQPAQGQFLQQPSQGQQFAAQPGQFAMGMQDASSAFNGQYANQNAKETNPKYQENKFGQVYGMMNDIMEGKADMSSVLNFIQSSDGDFVKGMLVGGALTFLLNNDAVKGALAGVFGSTLGSFFGEEEGEMQVEDMIREQEAAAAKES